MPARRRRWRPREGSGSWPGQRPLQSRPHNDPTSPTQIESQVELQQYGSAAQMVVAQSPSQPVPIGPDCGWQMLASQLLQVCPQTVLTSFEQIVSQAELQQYGSTPQICCTHIEALGDHGNQQGPCLRSSRRGLPLDRGNSRHLERLAASRLSFHLALLAPAWLYLLARAWLYLRR